MEFMMIRSVKTAAGGNTAGDISKQVGLSNSHHHNNSLYQGATTTLSSASLGVPTASSPSSILVQQHQRQHQIPYTNHYHNSSFGDLFTGNAAAPTTTQFLTSRASNPNINNNNKFASTSAAAAANTTSASSSTINNNNKGLQFIRKKPATKLPIFFKSKETYDRIAKSATVAATGNINVVGHQKSKSQLLVTLPQLGLPHRQSYPLKGQGMVKMKKTEVTQKVFWERSLNLDVGDDMPSLAASSHVSGSRSSSFRSPRKRKQGDLKSSISLLFSSNKKLKFQPGSAVPAAPSQLLPMPNLLKPFSAVRNSGSTLASCSSAASSSADAVKQERSPIKGEQSTSFKSSVDNSLNTSLDPLVKTADGGVITPIENIFLKKYDPIRLLIRLRHKIPRPAAAIVKSVISPPTRKIIYFNDFPSNKVGNRKKLHVSNNYVSNLRGSCSKKKLKGKRTRQQLGINAWMLSSNARAVQATKESKRKCKATRLPKHQTRKRKVRIKFRSQVGSYGISEDRLRILAAVYLKRALSRQRQREFLTNAWFRNRLKRRKTDRKQRRQKLNKLGDQNQVSVDFKAETGVSNVQRPLAKFRVTNVNLPRPLPIQSKSFSLVETPFLLHTVELLRHKRELQDRLDTIESDGTVQKVGSLPEKKELDLTKTPLISESVLLKRRQVKHVISQKLLMCLATVGFTHIKLRPLEMIADATSNFLTKMAQRLKEVSEMEMHEADHGFPDAMERVLNEHGIGGIRGLEDFYRTQVNDYGNRMEEQCLQLRRQYAYKVRSKVGMMSTNVNTPNMSASSPSSSMSSSSNYSSVTTTISASSSSTTNNNIATLASSIMMISGGGSGTSGANGVVTSKSTLMAVKTSSSSSSSQPLSPGNSVLAEMLSSQEELASVRTPQGCKSPSLGGPVGIVERQLEELMGTPPPNVEIRPSSFPHPHHQRPATHPQQVPLHQLLASLSQQQQQSRPQHQQHSLPPSPQQQQQQQTLNQVALHSLHASPPHHLNLKSHHQQPQSCTPGPPQSSQQQQSHLTQLLQRPIPNQQSPVTTPPHTTTTSHHHHQLILHHHHPQQQTPPPRSPQQQATNSNPYHYTQHHQAHLTSPNLPSPLNVRNTNINTTTITAAANSPLLHHHPVPSHQTSHLPPATLVGQNSVSRAVPLKLNISKAPIDHTLVSGETTFTTNNATSLTKTVVAAAKSSNGNPTLSNNTMQAGGGGKLITIIRSSSGGPSQQGLMVNSNHQNSVESSSSGVLEDGNIISINLSGLGDVDGASSSPSSGTATSSSSSSKAKLKEAISQRNLLRLNFEQVPSGAGDSTVLLSSSSAGASTRTPPANVNVTNNVQFIGKVSSSTTAPAGGQQARMSWNTTNYS